MTTNYNDQKITLKATGIVNIEVSSYYPEGEFSIDTRANYSKFLDKLEGLGQSLLGKTVDQLKSLESFVNTSSSVFNGKRVWKPGYDTPTFDNNEPFTITLPFIFTSEKDARENLQKISKLTQLTAPSYDSSTGMLTLPGPMVGDPDKEYVIKTPNALKNFENQGFLSGVVDTITDVVSDASSIYGSVKEGFIQAAKGQVNYRTQVSFTIGNWFRIDNVIVTDVSSKIFPSLDRFHKVPIYTECDIAIRSARPPTIQDIESWFLLKTNRT